MLKLLHLAWLKRIFNAQDSTRKNYLRYILKGYGGLFFFVFFFSSIKLVCNFTQICYSGGQRFMRVSAHLKIGVRYCEIIKKSVEIILPYFVRLFILSQASFL